jgi:hypothetical protein
VSVLRRYRSSLYCGLGPSYGILSSSELECYLHDGPDHRVSHLSICKNLKPRRPTRFNIAIECDAFVMNVQLYVVISCHMRGVRVPRLTVSPSAFLQLTM